MAHLKRAYPRPLFTLVGAGVLAMGLSGAGLADPWMALVSDTGLFDTGGLLSDDTGEPSVDDTGAPGGDDTGEPSVDDTGAPGGDDTGEPSGDDSGEPSSDDTGDPGGDDTGEPSVDDTGDPGGDDTGEPAADDTGEPDEDAEPIDTGGKSAAELAGEKGGCGCAASEPPSGVLAVLLALGLVTRRRSVS